LQDDQIGKDKNVIFTIIFFFDFKPKECWFPPASNTISTHVCILNFDKIQTEVKGVVSYFLSRVLFYEGP
jgi:hypothetical protein